MADCRSLMVTVFHGARCFREKCSRMRITGLASGMRISQDSKPWSHANGRLLTEDGTMLEPGSLNHVGCVWMRMSRSYCFFFFKKLSCIVVLSRVKKHRQWWVESFRMGNKFRQKIWGAIYSYESIDVMVSAYLSPFSADWKYILDIYVAVCETHDSLI